MSIPQIITFLQFYLKNTCLLFQGKYYEQVHGAVMGSQISPLIANLFIKEFEVKALRFSPHQWLRYVDDTFVIQEAKHSQQLLERINSQDPHIQFTIEEPKEEGALPFLDTLVSPGPNNTQVTTVYRKPIHTNQCLHWNRNHFITAKIVSSILQHLNNNNGPLTAVLSVSMTVIPNCPCFYR